jgi:hypothetical protein
MKTSYENLIHIHNPYWVATIEGIGMDNQHKKITGYRDLTQHEIDMMNEIKKKSEEVGVLCKELQTVTYGIDQRWVNIGVTDLQKGFMALVRSVARPESF